MIGAAAFVVALSLVGCAAPSSPVEGHGTAPAEVTERQSIEVTPRQTPHISHSPAIGPESFADPVAPDPVAPTADQSLLLTAVNPLPAVLAEELFAGATEPGPVTPFGPKTAIDKQMYYMFATWNNYNVAGYGDYNSWGGDCQNFVSQSLVERGWAMQPEWHNLVIDGVRYVTAAFIHVPTFDNWLATHPAYATRLEFSQRSQVKVGDAVVFDWDNDNSLDHSMMVSEIRVVNGQIKIDLIGHNNDRSHLDLDGALSGGASGHFWSIP